MMCDASGVGTLTDTFDLSVAAVGVFGTKEIPDCAGGGTSNKTTDPFRSSTLKSSGLDPADQPDSAGCGALVKWCEDSDFSEIFDLLTAGSGDFGSPIVAAADQAHFAGCGVLVRWWTDRLAFTDVFEGSDSDALELAFFCLLISHNLQQWIEKEMIYFERNFCLLVMKSGKILRHAIERYYTWTIKTSMLTL